MSERVVTVTEAHVNFGELMQVVAEQNQTVFIARRQALRRYASMEEYTPQEGRIKNDWEVMVESVRARIATEAGNKGSSVCGGDHPSGRGGTEWRTR
ncbi:MAG: hypothetical protein H6644_09970 [Caldilineaceae bacterium]|nr:hypothetical protein [Caldilineaceae bacterium]